VNGEDGIQSIGDVIPDGDYGYIRRDVMIKGSSNATIIAGRPPIIAGGQNRYNGYNNTDNVTLNQFSIELNQAELQEDITTPPHEIDYPAYQIDPGSDNIFINITGLNYSRNRFLWGNYSDSCNLVGITFYEQLSGNTYLSNITPAINEYNLTINGMYTPASLPAMVNDSVSLAFKPGAFSTAENADPSAPVFINLTFALSPPQQYLNNTLTQPFDYNYDPANVTQPQLQSGVLEVAVW
jgi:hypothetical protein